MKLRKMLMSFIVLSSVLSHAIAGETCLEKYERTARYKKTRREATARTMKRFAEESSYIAGGFGVATVFNPSLAGATVAAATFMGTSYIVAGVFKATSKTSKEARILNAKENAKKGMGLLHNILKEAHRKGHENANLDDVAKVVEDGLTSGDFCSEKRLYGPSKIKAYVLDRL